MDWKTLITLLISALGLLATAIGGMFWVVNEASRYQDEERRITEGRLDRRMDREIRERDARDDRQDARQERHTNIIIDHEKRILRLENPNEEWRR